MCTALNRALLTFFIVLSFALYMHVTKPTSYFDNLHFDYNATSVSHAILFAEMAASTPNRGNLNINSHPGIPYYLTMGLVRSLMPQGSATTPEDRIVHLFKNIDTFWNIQAVLAGIIAALGAVLLSRYCKEAPFIFPLVLFILPFAYFYNVRCATYIYDITNETFALPVAALFFITSKTIISCSHTTKNHLLFIILGIFSGIAYTIKLPYIAFFFAGFVVCFIFAWNNRKKFSVIFTSATAYILGFLGIILCVGVVLGMSTVTNFIHYHYNVLTHSGFAGSGTSEIIDTTQVKQNIYTLVKYIMKLWPIYAFAIVCFTYSYLYKKKRNHDIKQISVIFVVMALFSAAVLKHWREHYALIIPITSLFLIYELLLPLFCTDRSKSRIAVCVIALLSLVTIYQPYSTFTNILISTHASSQDREQFTQKLYALPRGHNEAIYFQWGTHSMPVFSINHPINLTYLSDDNIGSKAFRKLVPQEFIFSNVAYRGTTTQPTIRYIVVFAAFLNLVPIIEWDTPKKRFILEAEDKVVLKYGSVAVIEKKQPILFNE